MFANVLVLALLGTSLMLADAYPKDTVSKSHIRYTWIRKVDDLVDEFDRTASKTYDTAQYDLQKVLRALKGKNYEAVTVAEDKSYQLKKEYEQLKNDVIQDIAEKKRVMLREIDECHDPISELQSLALNSKMESILTEEEIKFRTELKIWSEKMEYVRDEAARALKELDFDEICYQLEREYGEIYEANKEKLLDLKYEYIKAKEHGEIAVKEKKQYYKKQLMELEYVAEKARENLLKMQAQARIAVAAEEAKNELEKREIEEKIRKIIRSLEILKKQKIIPYNKKE